MAGTFRSQYRSRRWGETTSRDIGLHLEDRISDVTRELIEDAYPEVGEEVIESLLAMRDDAKANWPVKSGRSKKSIAIETRIVPDVLTVSLVVREWYAGYIRSKGEMPAYALVLDKAEALAERLAQRVGQALSRKAA